MFSKKTQEGLLIVLQCAHKGWKAGQKSEENMYHDDCNKSKERVMKANLGKCLLADDMLCIAWSIHGTCDFIQECQQLCLHM